MTSSTLIASSVAPLTATTTTPQHHAAAAAAAATATATALSTGSSSSSSSSSSLRKKAARPPKIVLWLLSGLCGLAMVMLVRVTQLVAPPALPSPPPLVQPQQPPPPQESSSAAAAAAAPTFLRSNSLDKEEEEDKDANAPSQTRDSLLPAHIHTLKTLRHDDSSKQPQSSRGIGGDDHDGDDDSKRQSNYFLPGTLASLDRTQTIAQCYVPPLAAAINRQQRRNQQQQQQQQSSKDIDDNALGLDVEYAERRQMNCLHAVAPPASDGVHEITNQKATTTATAANTVAATAANANAAAAPHWLTLRTQPKVGSSTLRKIMHEVFGAPLNTTSCAHLPLSDAAAAAAAHGNNNPNNPNNPPHHWYWTVTRDPLSRFISGYKEYVLERAELYKDPDQRRGQKIKTVPPPYARFANHLASFSSQVRHELLTKAGEPEQRQINLQLFDMFVQDYDGQPFDEHLVLQMSRLWSFDTPPPPPPHNIKNNTSGPNHRNPRDQPQRQRFDAAIDIHDLVPRLREVAQLWNLPWPTDGQPEKEVVNTTTTTTNRRRAATASLHARPSAAPELIDVAQLSQATIRKLCRLLARDYCCLNYKLPPACVNDNDHDAKEEHDGGQVMCEWVPVDGIHKDAGGRGDLTEMAIRHVLV